jgi:hypothetical protein
VVFDPLSPSMDGFPKAVRAPLVYSYVTAAYVPVDRAGRFEVTRRRRDNEPVALAYWREKLGADLFVGHLPRLSSIDRYSPCTGGPGVACQAFGEITLAVAPPAEMEIALPIVAGSLQFRVLLRAVPHVTKYDVSLDRVWFWTAAKVAGFAPRLATEALMPGISARIVERQARQDILY